MLRDETMATTGDRTWSGPRWMMTALALLGLTLGVASPRGAARADEEQAPAPVASNPAPVCVEDNMDGVIAFRPAAALRRLGMDRLPPWVASGLEADLGQIAGQLQIDATRPGLANLAARDVEWVACGIGFDLFGPEKADGAMLNGGGVTIRMVAPFDWLAYLRRWQLEWTEIREDGRAFYRIDGIKGVDPADLKTGFRGTYCVYLPDDRTVMLASETAIRAAMAPGPRHPTFPDGSDWERASRGLLAVVLSNRNGMFAKGYDPNRPDDAVVRSLVEGVSRWTFGVDDGDAIALHASARCRDDESAAAIVRSVGSTRDLGRVALGPDDPKAPPAGKIDGRRLGLAGAFLRNLRIRQDGPAVHLDAADVGTFADFAGLAADDLDLRKLDRKAGERQPEGEEGGVVSNLDR